MIQELPWPSVKGMLIIIISISGQASPRRSHVCLTCWMPEMHVDILENRNRVIVAAFSKVANVIHKPLRHQMRALLGSPVHLARVSRKYI